MQSLSHQSSPAPTRRPTGKAASWCAIIVLTLLGIGALAAIGVIVLVLTNTPTAVQSAYDYKQNAQSATVLGLDKTGSAGKGTEVHFTCTIVRLVKDDAGYTAGANVTDSSSSIIQVAFPSGIDISQVNTGDTLEVWGTDQGAFSGQNAFGATIEGVVVQAKYMTDQTTGYTTN